MHRERVAVDRPLEHHLAGEVLLRDVAVADLVERHEHVRQVGRRQHVGGRIEHAALDVVDRHRHASHIGYVVVRQLDDELMLVAQRFGDRVAHGGLAHTGRALDQHRVNGIRLQQADRGVLRFTVIDGCGIHCV